MSTEELKLNIDSRIKDPTSVKKGLADPLAESLKTTKALQKQFEQITQQLKKMSAEYDKFNKKLLQSGAGTVRQSTQMLQRGTPQTALGTALARGSKADEIYELSLKRQTKLSQDAITAEMQFAAQRMRIHRFTGAVRQDEIAALASLTKQKEQYNIVSQREHTINKLLGDGGANLFKIQSGLLINYGLMSKAIQGFQFGVQYIVEFDRALKNLQAITDTSNASMAGLTQRIIEVSQTSKFSAIEVAQAATVMGQAGFSSRQIEDSIEGVTNFATAVGEDLAPAVDLATSVISVFNLQASDMNHVANVMTSALNLSKLTVDKLSLGLQYAGNTAAQQGTTFEELTSILAAMSNSGIRSGSTLGTGLRQLFIELQTPSEKLTAQLKQVGLSLDDVNIGAKGIIPVMDSLKAAGFGVADAYKAFDVRAAAAYLALSNNLELEKSMRTQLLLGNAALAAKQVQMTGIANRFANLSSSFGILLNAVFKPLVEIIASLAFQLSKVFQILNEYPTVLGLVGTGMGVLFGAAVIARVALLTKNLSLFSNGIRGVAAAFGILTVAETAATTATLTFAAVFKPILLIIGAVVAATWALNAAFGDQNNALDESKANFDQYKGEMDSYRDKIESVDAELARLGDRYNELNTNSDALQYEIIGMGSKFGDLSDKLRTGAISSLQELIEELIRVRSEFAKTKAGIVGLTIEAQTVNLAEKVKQTSADVAKDLKKIGISSNDFNTRYDSSTNNILNNPLDSAGYDQLTSLVNSSAGVKLKAREEALRKAFGADYGKALYNPDAAIKDLRQGGGLARFAELGGVNNAVEAVQQLAADRQILADAFSKLGEIKQGQLAISDTARLVADAKIGASAAGGSISSSRVDFGRLTSAKDIDAALVKAREKFLKDESLKGLDVSSKDLEVYLATHLDQAASEAKAKLAQTAANIAGERKGAMSEEEKAAKAYQRSLQENSRAMAATLDDIVRTIDSSTDKFQPRINRISAMQGEFNNTNSASYGKYSDAEMQMLDKEKYDLETAAMMTRIDAINKSRTAFEALEAKQRANLAATLRTKDNVNEVTTAEQNLEKTLDKKRELLLELDELQAKVNIRTGEATEVSKSLGEQLGFVLNQYMRIQNAQANLGNNIASNLTEILDVTKDSFGTLVKDVVTGTKTMGDAFKDMGARIVEAMLDIAIKSAASGFMGQIGSLFGFGQQAYSSPIGPSQVSRGGFFGLNAGGIIKANNGYSNVTRDSKLVMVRPGEGILRNSAMEMIGRDNFTQLNAMGNRRISETTSSMQTAPQSGDKVVNVYVLPPEEKPSLGPDDVLMIINKDMLQGGSTKKLVKQISMGN